MKVRLIAAMLVVALTSACGGDDDSGDGGDGSGGGSFQAAEPPSDVCAMLTLGDVQAVLPGAQPGAEEPTADTSDVGFWARICAWEGPTGSTSLELVVFGATTSSGLQGIKLAAASGEINMPVSGVGDEARYWQDPSVGTSGLWALKGSYSVDTTAYFFDPFPSADEFKPLVIKALGQL